MKLVIVGTGQGGANIADEFVALGKWIHKNRNGMRVFPGKGKNPAVARGVFVVNLAEKDIRGLQHIPPTEDYCILLGTQTEFHGRGAGKVNADGAEQARRGINEIKKTIADYSDVASADAMLVIATTAGGTGSGAVGVIVDGLKDEWPEKPVYAMLVLPGAKEYTDPDAMVNTATCLKRVIENSRADGVFLVDNRKLVEGDLPSGESLSRINRKIANSFMDMLCVGEETDRQYIGEMLDANDMIRGISRVAAIGIGVETVPPGDSFLGGLLKKQGPPDIKEKAARNGRAQNAVKSALANLSISCEYKEEGAILYNAGKVVVLMSGPKPEITQDVLDMVDDFVAGKVPGAGRKKGTYPGRTSGSITATIILSDIAQGKVMDLVQEFYEKGTAMKEEVEEKRKTAERFWDEVSEKGTDLPDL